MKAIMNDGSIKEIDTSFMSNNQYTTINGERIYDTQIKQIIDDIRLGEFYCCSKKQGTYEEVQKAINEERSKINHCKECYYNQISNRIEEECSEERIETLDKIIIHETTVYKKECHYDSDKKCVFNIDEKPRLFREVADCYFCDHPEGIPDMTKFIKFMIDNHEKYGIVPYWSDEEKDFGKDYSISFQCKQKFGSYIFEKTWGNSFELSNTRHRFKFIFNFKNKKFILNDGIGYKEVKVFTTSEYDCKSKKSYEKPIANFDKFFKWFSTMVEDFIKFQSIN